MEYTIPKNAIEFKVNGRYALFTDPITKLGGEKFSYHIPTYEALKGICKSIYWKPTFIWIVDKVRIMKVIQTQTKGMKPIKLGGGNDLAIYSYLYDVEYQVLAHFIWNEHRAELANDRIDGKHYAIAKRSLERGGRQDVFLGTRDCQGYVEPCSFGDGSGDYDAIPELSYDLMFHSFAYPDEIGGEKFYSYHWRPVMKNGIIEFLPQEDCPVKKFIREMRVKPFHERETLKNVDEEYREVLS